MDKFTKSKKFIKQPKYPGGLEALKSLISTQLVYPEKALAQKVEGTVKVRYTIGHKGNVIDTQILSSLGAGCDKEAIRLVKLLKFEVPKNRGGKIKFHRTINIHFRLPKAKPKPKAPVQSQSVQTVQYSIKPSKEKGKSYNYTIKI